MRILKEQLCDACRSIRPRASSGELAPSPIGEMLDGTNAQSEDNFAYKFIVAGAFLLYLQENGGCPKCIALVERIAKS